MTNDHNIANQLNLRAEQLPYRQAILFPQDRDKDGNISYTHYTFKQLTETSDIIAKGLLEIGITRGTRTVLMVKPSLEFFALTFALFKAGIVPVMIDPGIGLNHLKNCIHEAEPEAFIGIPKAHTARKLFKWGRSSLKHLVTVGGKSKGPVVSLKEVKKQGMNSPKPASQSTKSDEVAAILFTSGSTGPPKGVIYQHGHFYEQVKSIQNLYQIEPGEIDLPTFPLFALFDPALGMTTVVPDMDFTRPGDVNPAKIIQAIEDFGVTNMFGSPALLQRVGIYGEQHQISLPTLKRVISAGAPTSEEIIRRFSGLLNPEAQIFTPYGATEALPLCSIGSHHFLNTLAQTYQGAGICVGQPVEHNKVDIIKITDDVLDDWEEEYLVKPGEIGEIIASGTTVTSSYYNRPEANQKAKIMHNGGYKHRMGDVGYFDEEGNLWYCGRKTHRVILDDKTLFTIPFERIFYQHPAVYRAALVGVNIDNKKEPVLCVQLQSEYQKSSQNQDAIISELKELAQRHALTKPLKQILLHPSFPVDIRHNSKIFREKLTLWAESKIT